MFKQRWDILIIVCAAYNCFTIPFNVAFEPQIAAGWLFTLIDVVIDFIFFIDILITFRLSFINEKGKEVINPKEIAINYVLGMFWIDLAATVPIDSILQYIY